ncbi:MAG: hypothetical protein Q8P67_17250 [archaeon]|nr:hypothetical protein [archaeon]
MGPECSPTCLTLFSAMPHIITLPSAPPQNTLLPSRLHAVQNTGAPCFCPAFPLADTRDLSMAA